MDKKTNNLSGRQIDGFIRNRSVYPKVCFILGAGASRGYTEDESIVPPVVKELLAPDVNNIVQTVMNWPQHYNIERDKEKIAARVAGFGGDLETYLSNLFESNGADDSIFVDFYHYLFDVFQEASRQFSDDDNAYMDLINYLSDHRGIKSSSSYSIVTFNYDTLLERGYLASGRDRTRTFSEMSEYIGKSPIIVKIHGSVNFYYATRYSSLESITGENYIEYTFKKLIDDADADTKLAVREPNADMSGIFAHRTPWDEATAQHVHDITIPFIAMPIHEEDEISNGFFRSMHAVAVEQVHQSNLIIAIGYRFGDVKFVNSIKALNLSDKDLIIVGKSDDATKIVQELKSKMTWRNVWAFNGNGGFSDFVSSLNTSGDSLNELPSEV